MDDDKLYIPYRDSRLSGGRRSASHAYRTNLRIDSFNANRCRRKHDGGQARPVHKNIGHRSAFRPYPVPQVAEALQVYLQIMGIDHAVFTLLCVYFFGISRQDVQRREISNCAPVVLILASPFISTVPFPERILGLFGLLIPLAAVSIITNGFGMGDVKLCAAFGWTLGAFTAYCALAAALTAAVLAGKITHQKRLPLAPFLCGSGMVAILIMEAFQC